MGAWEEESLNFIKDLGLRIAAVKDEKRSTSLLFQRLVIAVQRGNAASILGTLPSNSELEEIYYLC